MKSQQIREVGTVSGERRGFIGLAERDDGGGGDARARRPSAQVVAAQQALGIERDSF